MTDTLTTAQQLTVEAAQLYAQLGRAELKAQAIDGRLDKHIHDAAARAHRRAAFNLIDRQKYAIGGAFEPLGGLDLDPVALTGFFSLGSTGLLLLVRAAQRLPEASIVGQLRVLFGSPAGSIIRGHGVWVRWHWLKTLYLEETERFLQTPKGRDPGARWRDEKPTSNQAYLVSQICLFDQIDYRIFATRGAAFDWIKEKGGNPRYRQAPPRPDLAGLEQVLR